MFKTPYSTFNHLTFKPSTASHDFVPMTTNVTTHINVTTILAHQLISVTCNLQRVH